MATRKDIRFNSIPATAVVNVDCGMDELARENDLSERRLYLLGTIEPIEEDACGFSNISTASRLVYNIMAINRADAGIEPNERIPVMLYINSPGGDITEGFALVAAIELSKTPIYTVNIGEWSSMSFLVGIAGHKRFSLPYATFLLHDGFSIAGGSASKVQDKVDFDKRFEHDVVRKHVLKYSNMKEDDYDMLARVELYMLPEDAKERGFIDEIVTDIDDIL